MSSKHKMTIQEVADEAQVSKTTVSFFSTENGKNVRKHLESHRRGR